MRVGARSGVRSTAEGGPGRVRDDRGGMWIVTGLVLGGVVYAGTVVMLAAGFSAVAPLVVIPPVLVALIGANNLLGGGRTHGRPPGRPVAPDQAPMSSSRPNGPGTTGSTPPAAPTEEPSGPR